jgi:hypothetical protein
MNDQFREMNDRIHELAVQSHLHGYMVHLYTVNVPDGYRVPLHIRQASIEKFAELIVNECVRIAELKEQGHSEYSGDVSVGWYIKNHFGVK